MPVSELVLTALSNAVPTVALNTPTDTATGQSVTPTLNFTGTDADGDAVEYQVQVHTNSSFGSGNNAVNFDTTTKYGILPNFSGIDGLSDFTVECWLKNQASSDAYSAVWSLYPNDSAADSFAYLSTENGTGNEGINWGVGYDGGTWSDGYTTSSYLTVGSWIHVALVHDSSTKVTKIYKDGVEISYNLQNTGTGTMLGHTTSDLYLAGGSKDIGAIGGFFRVWNTARTSTQLFDNKGLTIASDASLVINCNFSEGTGTTVDNLASAGNDITLYGSPSWVAGPQLDSPLITAQSGASISEMSDNFNDNSISSLWGTYTANSGAVSETSGQMSQTCANTTNGSWAGIFSQKAYDFTGCYVKVEAVDATGGNTYFDLSLNVDKIPTTSNAYISIGVNTGTGNLEAYKKIGGVGTILATTTFSAVTHKYWRLREKDGTTYFEYSADDSSWSILHSVANPMTLTSVYVILDDYEYNATGSPGAHIFDNLVAGYYNSTGFTAGHPFLSGAAKDYTVQSSLSNSTTYYWRVRAIDPTGSNTYGAWSSTYSFTTTAGGGAAAQQFLTMLGVG